MRDKLQQHLFNLIDVTLQTRVAHWNVRGANFSGLHGLFGEAYETLATQTDDVAERIAQLGALVDGSVTSVASRSVYPNLKASHDNAYFVKSISGRLEALCSDGVKLFNEATTAGDHVTANLIIDQSQALDKLAWLIKSHQ